MAGDRPALLLTGGSGVLGRALVAELHRDFDVTCLTHRTSLADPRVREIRGDLSRPLLGLSQSDWDALCARTDVVVHSGAVTRLARGFERADAVNVRGTEQMLHLADRAGARYVHISTAFVARRADGDRPERGTDGPGAVSMTPYLWSKDKAEQLVRASGVPHAVARPSVLIGDSHTGEISAFQGMYTIFGALLEGRLPLLPGSPDTGVDFLPRDVAARAVAHLAGERFAPGEYWLCAGPSALTAQEMIEVCMAVGDRLGTGPHRPRIVTQDMMDRLLLPLAAKALPYDILRSIEGMMALATLFSPDASFPSSLAAIDPALQPERADLVAAFERSLAYFAVRRTASLQPSGARGVVAA